MIGPITSMSMAGKISVATGSIIFTGAFATLSSSLPFLIDRASTASKLRFSAIEVPNRMDLITFSANLSKSKESYDRAIWRNPSLRSMSPLPLRRARHFAQRAPKRVAVKEQGFVKRHATIQAKHYHFDHLRKLLLSR